MQARRAPVWAQDFQLDMLTTAREPDELIVAVRFPVAATRKAAFREVARRHGDFAIIAVGAVIEDEKTRAARHRRHGRHAGGAAHRRSTGPRMRSTRSPTSSKATRTCMPRPSCAATSCAIWRRW